MASSFLLRENPNSKLFGKKTLRNQIAMYSDGLLAPKHQFKGYQTILGPPHRRTDIFARGETLKTCQSNQTHDKLKQSRQKIEHEMREKQPFSSLLLRGDRAGQVVLMWSGHFFHRSQWVVKIEQGT